jgi:hypothetical protein
MEKARRAKKANDLDTLLLSKKKEAYQEYIGTCAQLVDDACNQMVVDRDEAKAAYERYHTLAEAAYASKQVYQARQEALRLLFINQPQGCEI